MKIAILGAGPSGLMAAHAVSQCGAEIKIYDKFPDKSRRNAGVFFLHDDCDLLLDATKIKQTILGSHLLHLDTICQIYSQKVYGKDIGKVSILEALKHDEVVGYNAGQAIDRLWSLYGSCVQQYEIKDLRQVIDLLWKFDKIISTIPASILYPNLNYDKVETFVKVETISSDVSFIFYNVNKFIDWYRCSAMFGVFVKEFDFNYQPLENEKYKKVTKVIGDGIKSDIPNLLLTGRYGSWKKSMLTHDVYYDTLKWLTENDA